MKIIITAREALDKCVWAELCSLKHINPYAVKEGLMDESHEIELSLEEAEQMHLISKRSEDGKHYNNS